MFNKFLSLYLCGYGKGTSHTKALISLIVKWANLLQIKHFNRAVLMDLSKAFDKNHDLLIAKIHTDCFDKSFSCLVTLHTDFKEQNLIVPLPLGKNWYEVSHKDLFSTYTRTICFAYLNLKWLISVTKQI